MQQNDGRGAAPKRRSKAVMRRHVIERAARRRSGMRRSGMLQRGATTGPTIQWPLSATLCSKKMSDREAASERVRASDISTRGETGVVRALAAPAASVAATSE